MKKKLRQKILAWRDEISPEQLQVKSKLIMDRLLKMDVFQQAQTVMFFLSFKSEVNTFPMIQKAMEMGKRIVVPKTVPASREMTPSLLLDLKKDLEPGLKGILEPGESSLRPVSPAEIQMVLVPGVAFDRQGKRLGYGGGYYDRFFNLLRENTPLVALAFSGQVVDNVPTGPFDQMVDALITEEQTYFFNPYKLKKRH